MKRLCALAFAFSLTACGGGKPVATPAPLGTPEPSAVPIKIKERHVGSRYIYLTEQKQNRKVYVIRADSNVSIRLSQGSGHSDFVNPHVTFFENKGTLVADSPHARAEERDRSVLMDGGVRARNSEGMTLQSDTLRYDDGAEKLHGEGNVVIVTAQGEELRGRHFDYDLRTTEMRVTGEGA